MPAGVRVEQGKKTPKPVPQKKKNPYDVELCAQNRSRLKHAKWGTREKSMLRVEFGVEVA